MGTLTGVEDEEAAAAVDIEAEVGRGEEGRLRRSGKGVVREILAVLARRGVEVERVRVEMSERRRSVALGRRANRLARFVELRVSLWRVSTANGEVSGESRKEGGRATRRGKQRRLLLELAEERMPRESPMRMLSVY